MKKFQSFFLFVIIFLGLIVRLYRFDFPIADWHSWRQADTASVSRMFVQNGFDLIRPRYQDISNIASKIENPQGYRFVEFPIYNALQAGLFISFGKLTIEEWGRIVTIFASLSTSLFIFLLVRKYVDYKAGLFASFFYTFLPYSIFYGRTLLPDTLMVASSMGGVYFFDKFISYLKNDNTKQWLYFVLSIIFISSALLLKPFAVFLLLPILYIAFSNLKMKVLNWKVITIGLLSVIPLITWRVWMQQFPEGIPLSDWLFNEGNLRFKGAFFYWVFDDHIGKLILGYFGAGLLSLGLLKKVKEKSYGLFLVFLISALSYLFIVARGNVQHDYYQIVILPVIAIFLGRGASFLLDFSDRTNRIVGAFVLLAFTGLTIFSSWYIVRDYFNINDMSIVVAGKKADEILPKNAKVIAPQGGSTVLLYYTNRQGWPFITGSIERLMKLGATHLAISSPQEGDIKDYSKKYKILAQSKDYLILDLR